MEDSTPRGSRYGNLMHTAIATFKSTLFGKGILSLSATWRNWKPSSPLSPARPLGCSGIIQFVLRLWIVEMKVANPSWARIFQNINDIVHVFRRNTEAGMQNNDTRIKYIRPLGKEFCLYFRGDRFREIGD